MTTHTCLLLALAATLAVGAPTCPELCEVRAKTAAGWVCGLKRIADNGNSYASFRGVPYAQKPLGELRFKELKPLKQWDYCYNATVEKAICYQTDAFYGKLMYRREMSEDCIYANIHVPLEALPVVVPAFELQPPRVQAADEEQAGKGLPILVFVHGGGFAYGSGDTDIHGPEYLVGNDVIVITFNYRVNIFGFLSLNTSEVPGNAALRDMLTLLKWVQENARAFGGDPDNVTLGGQSAGAIAAHLLSLSKAAEGLFKRAILMSGTAITMVYSPSPAYAHFMRSALLAALGINATDPDVYQKLVAMPAEKLQQANKILLDQTGLVSFVPVVESPFPGVTTVIDDYPEALIAQGRGQNIPLLVGYTNAECENYRPRFQEFDLVQKIKDNMAVLIPPSILFTTPQSQWPNIVHKLNDRYYNGTISVDNFVNSCTDVFYEYPVLKLVESRATPADAPVYVYKFSYDEPSVFKEVNGLKYRGAGHTDDLTTVFKINNGGSQTSHPSTTDTVRMRNVMAGIFVNFMCCSKPVCNSESDIWPPSSFNQYIYEELDTPKISEAKTMTSRQQDIQQFFDNLTTTD